MPARKATTGSTRPRAPRTTSRQLLSREERSASILHAAAVAFAGAGFAATSMDDVALAAGVTKLIVYRHFDSKEELYRAVLERVTGRLREELVTQMQQPPSERYGFTTRAILNVAREDPEAVRLLFVHAEREPQFAIYAREHREGAVEVAEMLIGDRITDPAMKDWAARVAVRYLTAGVMEWLDHGDPARDEEFVARSTSGLLGMFLAWLDPGLLTEAEARFRTEAPPA